MGTVRRDVVVAGRNFLALFDTVARNTYVGEDVAALLDVTHYPRELVELLDMRGEA